MTGRKLDPQDAYARDPGWSQLKAICKGNPPRPVEYATTRNKITHRNKEKKKAQLTSGVMGLLTGPHQTSFSEDSSLTIRLSDGERPVLAPEYALRAPLEVIAEPVS